MTAVIAGPKGWRFCTEECAADQEEWSARQHVDAHVGTRDLLCECEEFCAPRGLPTAEMRQEYADYLASIKGTSLDPDAAQPPSSEASIKHPQAAEATSRRGDNT